MEDSSVIALPSDVSRAFLSSTKGVPPSGTPFVDFHLRTDTEWIRILLETMSEGLAILDAEDHILYANQPLCTLLGFRPDEVVGLDAKQFLLPDQLEQYALHKRSLRQGKAVRHEVRILNRSGQQLHMLVSPSPMFDGNGKLFGSLSLFLDLTPQKRAEHALDRERTLLDTLIKHSRDCVYRINLNTNRYEFISPSVRELLGYEPEEFLHLDAERLHEMVHPADKPQFYAYARRLLSVARKGGSGGLGEYRMRTKSGEYRWLSDSAAVLVDDTGHAVARIGAARDITESKMAERALLAASRMEATTTLAGGIAHDFNNLMAAVLANAELLEMRMEAAPECRQMLQVIQRSAEQAGYLAQQMLAYARGGKYQLSVMDLNQTVREVLELESHSFDPKIEVLAPLEERLWNVQADPSQMSQVVMNLTINAAEAMPRGGRLQVVTENVELDRAFAARHPGLTPGKYVLLRVEDTGEGMSPQVASRVFEPFFSTKFQGRGLGLAAVYGIVKNHGGHISVQSEPGSGSCFSVYLPATFEVAHAPAETSPAMPTGEETVLLVDDEIALLEATEQMLQRLGYRVLLARNGQEALEMISSHPRQIQLVILDLAMPVMSGAEAHAIIAEHHPELRVIVCSGFECEPATRDMMDRGVKAFLQKPFRMQQLAAEVRRALDN